MDNIKYIKITKNNLDDYTNVWLEVNEIITKRKVPYPDIINSIRTQKKEFLDIIDYAEKGQYLDFCYIARGLELDGIIIGFMFGVIRYFGDGLFLQIGLIGLSRRYQRKGYGKYFLDSIIEEMKISNINYIWCIAGVPDFFMNSDFIKDDDKYIASIYTDHNYYREDKIYIKNTRCLRVLTIDDVFKEHLFRTLLV
jgi:GNAT superfamily N-acetyltransferase